MPFFIIFGWRGVTSSRGRGSFHCPHCGGNSAYNHKSVRQFFTLYFIPVIPLNHLGEYVECQACQGTFDVRVLNYDPSQEDRAAEAMFMVAMKQVMVALLLADGVIDDEEVSELQNVFESLTGAEVTEQDLREEIAVIQRQGSSAVELVSQLAPTLNAPGKEMVIKAAYRIASADGHIDESEQKLITDIAAALELTNAHLRGIVSELRAIEAK